MTFHRSHMAWGALVAGAILASGGMAAGVSEEPVRMSALKVSSIAGYQVTDLAGLRVGEISEIECDDQGRTRWINIDLDAGGQVRVASFRADLDSRRKLVSLRLSEDLLISRADASAIAVVSSPSV